MGLLRLTPSHIVPEHGFPDDDGVDVRRVQPYEAVKVYRCPGCDHEIRTGEGHVVVVPRRAPGERRHWHGSCWDRDARRTRRSPP